jgi:glyoxylase-like metal-dependent hydrolase (beta-lactamase superfamily II)
MEAERELLEGRGGVRSPFGRLLPLRDSGIRLRRGLKDGEDFSMGSLRVKVYAVPGHTDGSAAFLINGVLYLGDSADSSTAGKLLPGKWLFCNDLAQNRDSLKRLAEIIPPEDIKYLVFAHSAPLAGLKPLLDFAEA